MKKGTKISHRETLNIRLYLEDWALYDHLKQQMIEFGLAENSITQAAVVRYALKKAVTK